MKIAIGMGHIMGEQWDETEHTGFDRKSNPSDDQKP